MRDAILYQTPVPVRELNPSIPPKLEDVITRCLQKDREKRYQDASEIRAELKPLRREVSSALQSRRAVAAALAAQVAELAPATQTQPAIDGWSGATPAPAPLAAVATPAAELPLTILPAARKTRFSIALTSIVIAAVIAGFVYWHSRASVLTQKETLILADFQNTTSDSVFDDSLKQALAIQLEQSQFLTVLSDRKIGETLKLMNRSADTRITKDVAVEICQRNGNKVVLDGSIAHIGDRYLIALQAANCQSGENIASAEAEAVNRDNVIRVLGQVGEQLRKKLGESRSTMEATSVPLEKVTTSSLEALQAHTLGQKLLSDPNSAIPYLKRAVELDQNFALAHVSLGRAYKIAGDTALSNENFNKAYQLRDRVSLRERLVIEGYYYTIITGELDKAIQSYLQLAQFYPDDSETHAVLGAPLYVAEGRYQEAAAEMRERTRLSGQPDYNLVGVYACLNRFDDAQKLLDQAPREVNNEFLLETRYTIAFLRGDTAVMQETVAAASGRAGAEDHMLSAQSDTEAYYGRLSQARRLSEAAVRSAKRTEIPEIAAAWRANEALREVEMGNAALARQRAKEALTLSFEVDVKVKAALALARAGDTPHAQALVGKLGHEFPLDTMMQNYWLPALKAAIELQKPNADEAIDLLKPAMHYELGYTFAVPSGIASTGSLYPAYIRGLAYLHAGQGLQAAAEFQKLVDHRGILGNFPLGSLAYLQLGRAQVIAGDNAAARKSYQQFLTLWQDADPDIPVYKQAKTEYASLQ